MDKQHPLGDLMSVTMDKIRELVDVNTVIGQPIKTEDGITIIPVSRVSLGFASGGSDFQGKQPNVPNPFGGGSGAGVKITPTAFLVIKGGNVRVLGIEPPCGSGIDKVLDMAPEIIDKISAMIDKKKEK